MRLVRSLLFELLFVLWFVGLGLACVPLLPGPPRWSRLVIVTWSRGVVALARFILGIHFKVNGRENLPPAPFIIASKHQSTWETCALTVLFDDAVYVLKSELMWVPVFGWYAGRGRHIPVDRDAGRVAMTRMLKQARALTKEGVNIIIFPEGTRTPAGSSPKLKPGVVGLYRAVGVPVVPISLDSGLYWPRRGLLKRPGTIEVHILPPLEPGLDKDAMLDRLQVDINTHAGA